MGGAKIVAERLRVRGASPVTVDARQHERYVSLRSATLLVPTALRDDERKEKKKRKGSNVDLASASPDLLLFTFAALPSFPFFFSRFISFVAGQRPCTTRRPFGDL